jgi:hypothetical protein
MKKPNYVEVEEHSMIKISNTFAVLGNIDDDDIIIVWESIRTYFSHRGSTLL